MISSRAIVAFFLIVAATPARGQPAGRGAEELYNQGRALVAAGNTVEACAAFEQSQKLEPKVTTLIALAACRERLGQLATALELLHEAEQQTRSASDDTSVQLHDIALDRVRKLAPRVPTLTISIPDQRKIDGLEILRDKEVVAAASWNRALPIDGGTFTITARAPGRSEWSTRVTLGISMDSRTVEVPDLEIAATIEPVIQPPRTLPAKPAAESARTGWRAHMLSISLGAGAVGLLGGALGLSLWGDSMYEDAKAELADQARRDALEASAERKRYAAEGLAIAGVGCAGVAVWLYVRQRGTKAEPSSTRAGRWSITPTTSGIGVAGRF